MWAPIEWPTSATAGNRVLAPSLTLGEDPFSNADAAGGVASRRVPRRRRPRQRMVLEPPPEQAMRIGDRLMGHVTAAASGPRGVAHAPAEVMKLRASVSGLPTRALASEAVISCARLPLRLAGPRTPTLYERVAAKQGNPAPRLTDHEFYASCMRRGSAAGVRVR